MKKTLNLNKKTFACAAVLALGVSALPACVASKGASATATGVQGLVATGGFSTKNPDGKDVKLDYAAADVTVTMTHKQTADGIACVPQLTITAELPTTTSSGLAAHMCKFQLDFNAGFAGEGLILTGAKFYARQGLYANGGKDLVTAIDCAAWASTEPAKGEVVYEMVASQNPPTIGMSAIDQPYANQTEAVMNNQFLKPSGTATMKFKGRQFSIDLGTFSVKGDVTSHGDPNLACAKTYHDLPNWQLPDVNPASAGYNATYGLDTFHGKRIILDMGAGWCAACLAQADVATKIKKTLDAAGRTDIAFVQLCDVSQPEEMAKHTEEPLLKGDWTIHKQTMPDGKTHVGSKSDAFAYDYDGRLMGFFEGNGTVYTDSYEEFINHVISAPKDKPDFITCPTGGYHVAGKSGCVITE